MTCRTFTGYLQNTYIMSKYKTAKRNWKTDC